MKKLITITLLAIICHFYSFGQCPISGILTICGPSYTVLSDSGCTGTWSSSNVAVATVGATGVVTGVSYGTSTITFTSGSSYSTVVVTVSPVPAAIAGATSFCSGSSVALTDATGGGVWSTSAYTGSATIGATTGLITGVTPGEVFVSYTVGGCSAVTVDSVLGATVDSITGPSSVCVGSTITLTDATPGGVWSSSSTAVATVGGTTGIVLGIATGSLDISYSVTSACGTTSRFVPITVTSGTSAGTITGTTTTTVGGTSTLMDGVSGGTWSSSNPTIATVSSTGVVTGVAAGTTTISYAVSGCSGSASAITTFTVTPFDGIAGQVLFGTTSHYGNVKVWLITFNTTTLDLEAYDSTIVTCMGTAVNYQFTGLPTDSFRVKAATMDSVVTTTGFIPTYHTNAYHWNTATVIPHVSGTSDLGKDITMNSGTTTTGPGFIAGNVLSGADKGTSGGTPVVGMLVYVVNSTSGVLMQKTYTDALGNYSFSNLPVGATYYIYPEAINYATTIYSGINLTSSVPSMNVANFKQHTISKTITPMPVGINDLSLLQNGVVLCPNPSSGNLSVQWNQAANEKGEIVVTDMTGRELYKNTVEMNSGMGSTQINLSSLADGMYLISVKSASINYISKIKVQH